VRKVLVISFTPIYNLDGELSSMLGSIYDDDIDLLTRYWYDIRDLFVEVISYGMSGVEIMLYFENLEIFEKFSKLEALKIMEIKRYIEVYGGKTKVIIGNNIYDMQIAGALFELIPVA